jgi:L-serine dehydratase
MALSALDLFSVGIGPSSSHTVGPMRAAKQFADGLKGGGLLSSTTRVQAELFGSLGATGRGHGSDKAVVLGLQGLDPETVDTSTADDQVAAAALDAELRIGGDHRVDFNWDEDVVLHRRKSLPAHPNGMTFRALDHTGTVLSERSFYSIGGGFVVDGDADAGAKVVADETALPYPFTTANELLEICSREGMSISDVMLANELVWRSEAELREELLKLWAVMRECVDNGCAAEGILPGGLNVRRRAPSLFRTLTADTGVTDPLRAMEWVNLLRAGGQRGERGRRAHCDRPHQRGGRHRSGRPALLRQVCSRSRRRRCGALPAGGGRRRDSVQDQRLHLRCGGGLPGRGRLGLLHGPRPGSARCSAAPPNRWRTPPRWGSNTTLA